MDLSADFRFRNLETYRAWYRPPSPDWPHPAYCEAQTKAVYGLPELYREAIAPSFLVGCPGHIPTASLLALAPLLRQGLVEPDSIVLDVKLGAGDRSDSPDSQLPDFAEADSVYAYDVAQHRHTPEIEQVCSEIARQAVRVQLTPHRIPLARVLLVTLYASLHDPGLVGDDLVTIYRSYYKQSACVAILANDTFPKTRWVAGTNRCAIGLTIDSRTNRLIVLSALDPFIKGRMGQAIQCLNLMMDWPETLGLPMFGTYL